MPIAEREGFSDASRARHAQEDEQAREVFLLAVRAGYAIDHACATARVSRRRAARWIAFKDGFVAELEAAKKAAASERESGSNFLEALTSLIVATNRRSNRELCDRYAGGDVARFDRMLVDGTLLRLLEADAVAAAVGNLQRAATYSAGARRACQRLGIEV